jgi:cyanosortase A-associated protein
MRLLRRMKRSVVRWFQDLISTPTWSGGDSRLGTWSHRAVLALAQVRMPFGFGLNKARSGGVVNRLARWVQVGLLSVFAVATPAVLGLIWLAPGWGAYQPPPVVYPDPPSVPGWESLGWEPIEIAARDRPRAVSGMRYVYQTGSTILEAEVRYLESASGDLASYWRRRTGLTAEPKPRLQAGIGSHQISRTEDGVWLDACLDRLGYSTATAQQFDANRRLHDRSLRRLSLWILARRPLEDRRCLWVHLALTGVANPEEESVRLLESFWTEWRGAWRGRLPTDPRI